MPFVHVHINSTGDMKACCISDIFLGNIKNSDVVEMFNSNQMKDLREKFLRDEADNRCKNCYVKEAAGKESMRLETLNKFEDQLEELIQNPEPKYFDIRFSNQCNLKCRTCWHGNSSKWFEDAKKLNRALEDKSLIKAFADNSELEKQLGNYIESAQEFYFAGGEPLLMEEHQWVLNKLIEKKNFSCLLRYNTNLTSLYQFEKNLIDLWKPFKQIEILASIDGLGRKGEIIRSGINLEKFESNFRKLKELDQVNIKIAPTLSLLNADLLPNLHRTYVEKELIKINDVHFNILDQPYHYNIKSLPKDQKERIQTMFEEHTKWIESNKGDISEWKAAIEYMNQDDWSNRYEKAKQETRKLDDLRGEGIELKIKD